MQHPARKLLNSWDCRALRAEVRQDGQNYLYVRGTFQFSKSSEQVKGNFSTRPEPFRAYFNALNRFERRDLYRDAVFSCRTPFRIALSSADTVVR
jgi:hypothetical protein